MAVVYLVGRQIGDRFHVLASTAVRASIPTLVAPLLATIGMTAKLSGRMGSELSRVTVALNAADGRPIPLTQYSDGPQIIAFNAGA